MKLTGAQALVKSLEMQEVEVMFSRGMPEFVRGRQISARVVSIAGPWRES